MYIVFLIGIHHGFARGLGWRGRRMFHPGFARGLGWRGRRVYPGFALGLGWRGRRMKGGQPLAPATARLFIAGTSHPQYLSIHIAESVFCHISIIIQ